MRVEVGSTLGARLVPSYLEGAKDLVKVAPPTSAADCLRLTETYSAGAHGFSLSRALVDGISLPREPLNQRAVELAKSPDPAGPIKTRATLFQANPGFANQLESMPGWYLAGQSTSLSISGHEVAQEEVKVSPAGFVEQFKLLQSPNYAPEPPSNAHQDSAAVKQYDIDMVKAMSVDQCLDRDKCMLPLRAPELQARYGAQKDMKILEIGPMFTTVVAQALLKPDNGNQYTCVERNPVAVEKQNDSFARLGLEHRVQQHLGDSHQLPVGDGTQDLVLGYASLPIDSPSNEALPVFREINRVLKPGGELLASGYPLIDAAPLTIGYLLKHSDVVSTPDPGIGFTLRKKAAEQNGRDV